MANPDRHAGRSDLSGIALLDRAPESERVWAAEMARAIKSAEEMKCVNASLRATKAGVGKLRDAIRPGTTENELWPVLHKSAHHPTSPAAFAKCTTVERYA